MNNTSIIHYSQRELETAYISPWQTLHSQDEIEFEMLRRESQRERDAELILRSIR